MAWWNDIEMTDAEANAREWLRQSQMARRQGELPEQIYGRQSDAAQQQMNRWANEPGGKMPWQDQGAYGGKWKPRPDYNPDVVQDWEVPGYTSSAPLGTNANAWATQRGPAPPLPFPQSDPGMMEGMNPGLLAKINEGLNKFTSFREVPATGNTGPVGAHVLGLLIEALRRSPGALQQASVPNPYWMTDPNFWRKYQNALGTNNGR